MYKKSYKRFAHFSCNALKCTFTQGDGNSAIVLVIKQKKRIPLLRAY